MPEIWRSATQPNAPATGEIVPAQSLLLDRALQERIVTHLQSALPNEGCGLLAGMRQPEGRLVARRFYPGTNRDASPTRYTMDPAEVMAAFRDLAAHGWSLGAIVHSHPATPPTPSPTDLREAFYPEALMLIVSFSTGSPLLRAWSIPSPLSMNPASVTSNIQEIPIVLSPDGEHLSSTLR